ncbi:hypothetical protein [Pseudomonas cyclaminis]|uniref:hypothetical protein n=1 Tax=Pseudomonas cyclaminis TaxID=2781239 RepID=UPI001FE68E3D|nr:hypothetical protein [Pseudomonas cyclaminis]
MPRRLKRSPLPLALAINLASLTALSLGLCSPVAAQEARGMPSPPARWARH